MQLLAASDFKIPKVSKKVRFRQVRKYGRDLFESSTSSSQPSLSNAYNETATAHCFLLFPRAPLGRDVHWKLEPVPAVRPVDPLLRLARFCRPTVEYWMKTEVHVYGFSVAANVLLSFFPFLIVMISLCKYVLRWQGAEQAIYLALADFFPEEVNDFLRRNLRATVNSRGPFQVTSILLLLFTANGIFEPLEVALNRTWNVATNRSFFRNQVVSMGLIFACGTLVMISAMLTAFNQQFWMDLLGPGSIASSVLSTIVFKVMAIPVSILILFLIYWLLPNRRIRPSQILPVAIVVGLGLELLKYVNLLTWPWLRAKLSHEYGPFINSVTIILWSFLAAMIVLAGAEWAARNRPDAVGTPPKEAAAEASGDGVLTEPSQKR